MTQQVQSLNEDRGIVPVRHEGPFLVADGSGNEDAYSATFEIVGEQASSYLGTVAIRHAPSSLPDARKMDNFGEPVRTLVSDGRRLVEDWLGPESAIAPVVRALGMSGTQQVINQELFLSVTTPHQPEDGNARLVALGIEDRKLVTYEGDKYSAGVGVSHAAKQEYLWATEPPGHFHDRTIHYPALALTPPNLLKAVAELARRNYGTSRLSAAMQCIDFLPIQLIYLKDDT